MHFNAALRIVTPAVLEELKRQSDWNLGGFLSINDVRQRTEDGFPVVELVCQYEKSLASFRVVFDLDDHVGSMVLEPIFIRRWIRFWKRPHASF